MGYIYCTVLGYFIGCINPAYLTGRNKGFDIREKGSKNAGATNAFILFGKVQGAVCAILDIAKAYLAILLTRLLLPDFTQGFAVTATACVFGHIFPFYMGFRGGKGTACLAGIVLAFDWRLFLLMLACEILVAVITDYVCFVPVSASVVFPFIYGFTARNLFGAVILGGISLVIFIKNMENFRRIRNGTEMRLRFLWNPGAELERMKQNLPEDEIAMHRIEGLEYLTDKEI